MPARTVTPASPERPGDPADRRGPFRPARLVTSRARQSGRQAAHGFRLADVAMLVAVTVVALIVVNDGPVWAAPLSRALPMIAAALIAGRMLRSVGLYRFGRRERAYVHAVGVALVVVAGALAGVVISLIAGHEGRPSDIVRWAIPTLAGLLVLHAVWWIIVRRWRREGRLTPNIVIVGATRHAERIVGDALAQRDVNVLGVFDDRLARSPDDVRGVPVLGDVSALLTHRITPYVDLIVIAVDPTAHARVREVMRRLAVLPNDVALVVDDEGTGPSEAVRRLADTPLAPLDVVDDPDRRAFAKRLQDISLAAIGLLLLSPVLAVIALLVKLDSPGPAFFRQRRHGFNNEEIVVWKFRTMRQEAADAKAERQITANDERVTRAGRILRKTSLDELPQLINVLQGSMSLVGPRPHAIGMKTGEEESATLVAEYAQRHRIKPGMTGWAAIHGSRGPLDSAEDVRRRVALDVHYIEHQSFWLDAWIIVMTVPSVLGDREAVR
jgi:Undecaprenyl-phosphate glucose phosphotransferase